MPALSLPVVSSIRASYDFTGSSLCRCQAPNISKHCEDLTRFLSRVLGLYWVLPC